MNYEGGREKLKEEGRIRNWERETDPAEESLRNSSEPRFPITTLLIVFCSGLVPKPSLFGNNRDPPWSIAHFDPAQFLARLQIHNGDVV